MSTQDAEAIAAFWRREQAIDEAQIGARLGQVVLHALDADGVVAGVCTAVAAVAPRLGQPVYFWRTFIGARWRSTRLVRQLLLRSFSLLESHAGAHDHPCIGVLLELENSRFGKRLREAEWPRSRFVYIGRSPRGLDVRIRYFKGARLKPSAT
jgi:hypothetical protein